MGIFYFSKIDKLISGADSKPKNVTGDKEQLAEYSVPLKMVLY